MMRRTFAGPAEAAPPRGFYNLADQQEMPLWAFSLLCFAIAGLIAGFLYGVLFLAYLMEG